MSKYLSDSPIWFPKSDELSQLNGKEVVIRYPDGNAICPTIRIDEAAPYSGERGKVSIMVWDVGMAGAIEWQPMEQLGRPKPIPSAPIGRWQRYLTQDAISLISSRAEPWLPKADFTILLPSDSDRDDYR